MSQTSFRETSIEEVKKYWDRRPCNVRHSPEYFDEVEARKYFVEPHIPRFAEFERWNGKNILEIGCGIGTDTINFARHGANVTAIDLSEESLKLARQRAEVYGLQDRITFYQGDSERLTEFVPVEAYDLIYSFGVIYHTPHPQNVIDQIRVYTHAQSCVKLMVYYQYVWKVFWILLTYGKGLFWKLSKLVARHSEAQTGCSITYTYTKRTAIELLERRGFRVTDIRVEHIFPYRFPDYTQYRYVKVWYFRWMPEAIFCWLETHLGWHLCLTAVPDVII